MTETQPDPDAGPTQDSALSRETPPHVDPADPKPDVDPEALDTEELGEGGPAGA